MYMINLLKQLFLKKVEPKTVPAEPVIVNTSSDIPEELMWQTLLLKDDELIYYKDENGQVHYFCTKPFDKNKTYKVLIYN
jgi:hypothetical protein